MMYVDQDFYGKVSIMDISDKELEILRCAFLAFKTGLVTPNMPLNHRYFDVTDQVFRIDLLLGSIERIQKEKQQQKQHP